jgi:hypothetical protein
MSPTLITFTSKLWRYTAGKGSWYFLTLPRDDTDFIRWIEDKTVVGFGSVRVRIQIGSSEWETLLFPTKDKDYLLPIKADVRKKENLHENMEVECQIELV